MLYVHVVLNSAIFSTYFMILFYMLDTFYLSGFFPKYYFINYVSSYRKI